MLTAIRKCFDLVAPALRPRADAWPTIPEGDDAVYEMICRADTMGVFQIESRAQMSMLPRLQPRCVLRPGDRGGHRPARADPGKHGPSLSAPPRRRGAGRRIPTRRIRGVLEKTLGVPLFQEQAMRLAVVAAGFTPGEADQLRRAMGAWRRPGVIEQFRQQADRRHARPRLPGRVCRAPSSSRSAASASTAFPNRTPPASPCWSTSPPG